MRNRTLQEKLDLIKQNIKNRDNKISKSNISEHEVYVSNFHLEVESKSDQNALNHSVF